MTVLTTGNSPSAVKTAPTTPETISKQQQSVANGNKATSKASITYTKSVETVSRELQTTSGELKSIIFHTTLIRDHNGLGFSVRGGKGCPKPFKEGSESVYISRIEEGGAAQKDRKLAVGDRVLKIGNHDTEGATYQQVISWLTNRADRFVRLVVERESPTDMVGMDGDLLIQRLLSSTSTSSN